MARISHSPAFSSSVKLRPRTLLEVDQGSTVFSGVLLFPRVVSAVSESYISNQHRLFGESAHAAKEENPQWRMQKQAFHA